MREMTKHPEPARLEALADGTLPQAERGSVDAHVQACGRCAAEVEDFRQLFAALAELPRVAPSAGFEDRVMARVRVAKAPAGAVADRPSLADRLRALVPSRRMRWSLAAAFSAFPVLGTGAAVAWLATEPSLSIQALWIFAAERFGAAASGAAAWAVEGLAATRVAGWLSAFGKGLVAVGPGQLGAAALALALLTAASAWVLYSNLIRTPTRERHHVSYSF